MEIYLYVFLSRFGSPLFQKLQNVFDEYIFGMQKIVMMDEEFDKHELVLILNSAHNSMKFLDNFYVSLSRYLLS